MTQIAAPPTSGPNVRRAVIRRIAQILIAILIYGIILFVCAGTLRWPTGWIYLIFQLLIVSFGGALVLRRNPDVVVARSQIRSDIESWDKWISILVSFGMFAGLAVPGLDFRFAWSTRFPLALQVLGFGLLALGYALLVWAMQNNPFFESGVRIQTERGQTVATSGPYRFVRHPGYVGMILQQFGSALGLGSWWALIAAALASLVFVIRTALEDRTLQRGLPGYADFVRRVRFRLVPGLW